MEVRISDAERVMDGDAFVAARFSLHCVDVSGAQLTWDYELTPAEVVAHTDGKIDDLIARETISAMRELAKIVAGPALPAKADDLIGASVTEDRGTVFIDKRTAKVVGAAEAILDALP